MAISSLIDTWILLRDIELSGERNRALYVLKSRGMAHSNQVREFILSNSGIQLREAYLGPAGVLTGSARVALEAKERAEQVLRRQEIQRRKVEYERKCRALEIQIASLRADLDAERYDLAELSEQEREREETGRREMADMARSRRTAPKEKLSERAARRAV